MPIQEMIAINNSGDREAKMSLLLATLCAPLLRGLAPANVLTVDIADINSIRGILKGTDITFMLLAIKGKKAIVCLYREKELRAYLEKDEIQDFLKACGYSEKDSKKLLQQLGGKLEAARGNEEYPHEMGVFLGYPLEDVKGFIENKGENFIHIGYWKVYHNLQESRELFRRFDAEREWAVRKVIEGCTITELAC